MLKHQNMRNELRSYLSGTLEIHGKVAGGNTDASELKNAWFDQKYAIDFVLEDIDILNDGASCIGILLYNPHEVEAVRKVGVEYLAFYQIGQRGDYKTAFASSAWHNAYVSSKTALEIMLLNDANPPPLDRTL